MKVLMITVILAMANVAIAAPSCPKENWCQGCDNTNMCTACVSSVDSEPGPRYITKGKCDKQRSQLIAGCKMYRNVSHADESTGRVCKECDGKKWLNIDTTTSGSKNSCTDTPYDAINCKTQIANCDVSACYKKRKGHKHKAVCQRCSAGYWPNKQDAATELYQGCTNQGKPPVANVSQFESENGFPQPYVCVAGHTLNYNGTACESIPQNNCRKMSAKRGTCGECDIGHYFEGPYCRPIPKKAVKTLPKTQKPAPPVTQKPAPAVAQKTAPLPPSCNPIDFCQGCGTDHKCTACLSWALSNKKARYLVNGHCKTIRTKAIWGCQMYRNDAGDKEDSCIQCTKDQWLNIDASKSPKKHTCDARPLSAVGCRHKLANCVIQGCWKGKYKGKNEETTFATCQRCQDGYWPKTISKAQDNNTGCTNQGVPPKPYVKVWESYGGDPKPYICIDGYYLNHKGTDCIPKANIPNHCRRLQEDEKNCAECEPTFYFDGGHCKLKAGLYILNTLVAAFLLMSF